MSQQTLTLFYKEKVYPLFKRGDKTDSPWWLRLQTGGVRRSLSLNTADDKQAKERAIKFIDAATSGDWMKADTMRKPLNRALVKWPTLGKLIANMPDTPSSKLYADCATTLAAEARGISEADAIKLTVDHFTPVLVRAFQAKRQGLKKPDPGRVTAMNAGANSVVKNARCLFSKKALAHYERLGISLPDLSGLFEVPQLIEELDRYSDAPITDDTLRKIEAIIATKSPQVQQAHWSIRLHGMTPGDIEPNAAKVHAKVLAEFGHKPSDLWHHAAACMLRRTGSTAVVAEWCKLTESRVKWHCEALMTPLAPLSHAETFLGV